jgi:hypothetical protein
LSLICSMTLICSAIGMNWSGGIRPSVSSCQRASASSALSSPVARSVIGWKTRPIRSRVSALPQRLLDQDPAAIDFVHLRGEDGDPRASPFLGAIERGVGTDQRLLDVAIPRHEQGQAGAAGDPEFAAIDEEGLLERGADGGPGAVRSGRRADPRQKQGEFVAAGSGDQGTLAGRPGEAASDPLEHPVAGGVTERVVDRLEAVEIDHRQSEALAGASDPGGTPSEGAEEGPAVGEAGQRVGVGDQPGLALFRLGEPLGALRPLPLERDRGARFDQLEEALVMKAQLAQQDKDDREQAYPHGDMGGIRCESQPGGQRQSQQQQRRSSRRRIAADSVGAADRGEAREEDDEIVVGGVAGRHQVERPGAESDAEHDREGEHLAKLGEDPLRAELAVADLDPVHHPHDDQAADQEREVEQGSEPSAGG